jgi:predicted SAM-dependent methyltransferase
MSDLVTDYFMTAKPPYKLEIGAGGNRKHGWLTTDLVGGRDCLAMDATQRFPFDNAVFDYVYSEHMIEHVPLVGGRAMLKECCRVMAPGAIIRIVTPSLDFLFDVYDNRNERVMRYIDWSTRMFVPDEKPRGSVVINNFVRAWGHQFIYDAETLEDTMREAGFVNICYPDIMYSLHAPLDKLEDVGRLPPGFLELESMILEGTKRL